ncbi:hypothetical protein Nepgr_026588 [Nepenthes gracilis]|uniref:Uncharacterized protein n=1 Tax=Nepenthes gracilis TaxID=150966 RepID=A0AAD3T836_NEPGR|nr:hypothetical protein Nepgr_026588 [Nepenthes gracilis]
MKNSIGNFDKQMMDEDKFSSHRRSFSGAIKRHCGAKSPSSPSPSNSPLLLLFHLNPIGFMNSSCSREAAVSLQILRQLLRGQLLIVRSPYGNKIARQKLKMKPPLAYSLLQQLHLVGALGDPSFAEYDTSIQQEDDRSIHSRKSSMSNKTLSNKRFFL